MSTSSATAYLSSASTGHASTPMTPDSLKRYLIDAPNLFNSSKDNHKLTRHAEKQILTNCYRALWSNNLEWMQHYFFKEGLGDHESLTKLLEKYDLFNNDSDIITSSSSSSLFQYEEHEDSDDDDDNPHSSSIQSNPENVLVDASQDEPEYWETQRGKQCGHLFKKGESVYRCRNCGLDDTCVMCYRCFHATNHEGHDVKIWISRGAGGCCDCGDPEAWKIPLECRIHALSATHDDAGRVIVRPDMAPFDTIPSELLSSVYSTIAVVLDYLLETFAASPEDVSPPDTPDDVLHDCNDSHVALGLKGASDGRGISYACVLWNDERHSFEEVNDIVMMATKCSKQEAQKVAENVDAYGRHVVFVSENLVEALRVANKIQSIHLAVTVRTTQTILREDICGLLLDWLKDLISGRLKFFTSVEGGTSILRDTLCKALCDDWALSPELTSLSTRARRGRNLDTDSDDAFDANELDISEDDDAGEGGMIDEDGNPTFLLEPVEMMDDHILNMEDIEEIIEVGQGGWESHGDDDEDYDAQMDTDGDDDDVVMENSDDGQNDDDDDDDDGQYSTGFAPSFNQISSPSPTTATDSNSNTTTVLQQRKPSSLVDIVDLAYDLDEWLEWTENLETSERDIAQSLGVPLSSPSEPVSDANDKLKKEFKRKLRLDYLLQFDLRLWKLARASIKDILIGTLISNFDYRPVLGTRFARNYPDLVDAFFFKDREPEHSVSSLSVQLLTVPTVAWMLVKEYKFFGIVSSILSNFFLTDHIHMMLPDTYRTMQVDCRSRSITRHRYAYTFFDLRYVLNADLVKTHVSQGPIYLRHFLDMLYQFQAMDPLERQIDTHVEYESSSWVSAFNVTLQISKLCRLFADCYASTTPTLEATKNLCRSIYRVIHQISVWQPHASTELEGVQGDQATGNQGTTQLLIRGIQEQTFHTISTPFSGSFNVVDYNVTKEPVSFHHPFHWLLSELLEHTSLLGDDLLAQAGWQGGFKQMMQMSSSLPYDLFLTILDYPLRTVVVLAQVNCGVWVRNGYGVRNQARTYRDISVRENTLDQDIYLLQVGFVASNPDHLLVTMLDRFKLWDWFNGKTLKAHPDYEPSQLTFIVEEFLNLLAIVATERGCASSMSIEGHIRRSIIQYLGISDMAYSELVKMVPESLSEHESFETTLATLATFKAPDGLNDHGLYELKDEFYDELDPYFWHFTRNHREEALASLRKRWKKHHPEQPLDDKDEFMVIPRLKNIPSGPLVHLNDFMHSHTFCQIITHALWNTKLANNPSDTILETTLYLAMVAVMTTPSSPSHDAKGKQRATTIIDNQQPTSIGFIQHATNNEYAIRINEIEREHATLLSVLLRCLNDQDLKHAHKRLHYIVERIEHHADDKAKAIIADWRFDMEQAAAKAQVDSSATNTPSEYERKKSAAKARQEAIMSQFAQAQSQFMSQHGDLYDDSDDEGDNVDDDMLTMVDTDIKQTADDQDDDNDAQVERMCHFPAGTCIVCQEELDRNRLYGVLGLAQKSHILRQTPLKNVDILTNICDSTDPTAADIPAANTAKDIHGFPFDAHIPGVQVSSCGHLMHAECFDNYQASVENEIMRAPLRELLPHILAATHRKRFLCPLCKALGNILLPVVWKGKKESYPGVMAPSSSYESIGEHLNQTLQQLQQQDDAIASSSLIMDSAQDTNLTSEKLESLQKLYTQLLSTLRSTSGDNYGIEGQPGTVTTSGVAQLFDMYSYTVASLEIAQRGQSLRRETDVTVEHTGTFLDSIPMQTQTLLKILAKTNNLLPHVLTNNWSGDHRNDLHELSKATLGQILYQVSSSKVPLLCDEPFRILTHIGFCHVAEGIHHVMRLLLLADITKTVIALMQGLTGSEQLENPKVISSLQHVLEKYGNETTTSDTLRRFAEQVMRHLQVPTVFVDRFFADIDPRVLVALVRTFTLPFLRKCLLLMVVHHGFVPPLPSDDDPTDEYDHLLSILNLPSLDQLVCVMPFEQTFLMNWCHHYRDHSLSKPILLESSTMTTSTVAPEYARLVQLDLLLPIPFSMVSLPHRMDQLFDESAKRVCRNCKTLPEDPALCLLCGTFVCARRYCCTEDGRGECNTHMRTCGGEIGIYMVIKECFILILHDHGGTIMSAPYLDAHGEADLFLKRGAPQYLNAKRYEQLRQMWLSHSIPAFVRRRMEVSYNYQRWESW